MSQFIKDYKCSTCEKLEKYWHHSDILSQNEYKYICDLIREKEGFCRPTLLAQITQAELKKNKDNNLAKRLNHIEQ